MNSSVNLQQIKKLCLNLDDFWKRYKVSPEWLSKYNNVTSSNNSITTHELYELYKSYSDSGINSSISLDLDWHGGTSFTRWYLQTVCGGWDTRPFLNGLETLDSTEKRCGYFTGNLKNLQTQINVGESVIIKNLLFSKIDANFLDSIFLFSRLSYALTCAPNFANICIIGEDDNGLAKSMTDLGKSPGYWMNVEPRKETPFIPSLKMLESAIEFCECLKQKKILVSREANRIHNLDFSIPLGSLRNSIELALRRLTDTKYTNLKWETQNVPSSFPTVVFNQVLEIFRFFEETVNQIRAVNRNFDNEKILLNLLGYGIWSHVLDAKHLLHTIWGMMRIPIENPVLQIGADSFCKFWQILLELSDESSFPVMLMKIRLFAVVDMLEKKNVKVVIEKTKNRKSDAISLDSPTLFKEEDTLLLVCGNSPVLNFKIEDIPHTGYLDDSDDELPDMSPKLSQTFVKKASPNKLETSSQIDWNLKSPNQWNLKSPKKLEPSSPNQWNVKSPNRLNSKLPSVVSKTGVFKLHDEPLTNTPGGFDDVESPRNVYLSVVKNVPENPLDDEEKISVGTEKNTLDESSQIPVSVINLVNRSIKDVRRTAPKRLGF
jgi:hypothetical protein